MFLHCNSEFSLIRLYYFFLIIQVLHCQTMLIFNYNLINTITYMFSSLYCFSHPTNHQHVAVKRLYVHKTRATRKLIFRG